MKQQIVITKELWDGQHRGSVIKRGNDHKLPYDYRTFLSDDYENGRITVSFQDEEIKQIICQAHKNEIDAAIKWVVENNPELKLVVQDTGWNGDDFIHDRVTALLVPIQYWKPKVDLLKSLKM